MGFLRSCSVVCLLFVGYIYAQSPKIIPEKNSLFLLEGADLKLDCVLQSSNGDSVAFYRAVTGGQDTLIETDTDGFKVEVKGNFQNAQTTKTVSLTKKNVTYKDRGVFKCKKTGSNDDTSINVYVFKVKQDGAVLNETTGAPLDLKCMAEGLPADVNYEISWRHNDKTLMDGERFSIFQENGTLRIKDPVREDMGAYFCTFVFPQDQLNVTAMEVELKAAPKVDRSDNNKNMVQGDTLELKCKVSGYPMPTVSWLKDGKKLNQTGTTRIHLIPHEGAESGKLQIYDLEYSDEGEYSCVAVSDAGFEDDVANMKVRVKDKLAALWPFLGIVAEVIILCVIILVYEKKRSKQMSDDDDAVDGNAEKVPDNKDVRHRRT